MQPAETRPTAINEVVMTAAAPTGPGKPGHHPETCFKLTDDFVAAEAPAGPGQQGRRTCTWLHRHLQGQADFHRLVLRGAGQLDGLVLARSKASPLQQLPVDLKVGLLRAGVDDLELPRLQQPGAVTADWQASV